ncbi:MAG: ATP-binding cassette domain-containing protein, partial [Lentisphaerae bacterium]|nr:ATP-binding cassette domain-containing protein [Lentisphaerota bacterium]
MKANGSLLEVRGLKTYFGSPARPVRAVDGISLDIADGTTVALVGESGCGKSVASLSLARLVPEPPGFYAGGSILFRGRDVLRMAERELADMRG